MNISTSMKKGILVIRAEGDLDMHVSNQFRQTFDEALDSSGARSAVLNFQGITFVDSSGIGVILGRYKRITAQGGKMAVTNLEPQVQKLFELAGLSQIIHFFNNETEALEML
ncbi:MAG TPA: anti-sigma F factor antagonist [Methylomusa anaerophila]|uniref:Anti-sigma F factor antagonist n=1 Tax=Methylomusa anaerophila TaxID=1930071 RepID=A0A348APE3_9FIRM|nr:anti-sigma F factor antagonist [Methylomusa anaerophila]BBB92941.1 anti-sigma F factor antagonist [Methylomusa anaerophila]HML87225.1 anti-sigma F factor antagonist [Methylomusa anaerophila]